MNPTCCAPHLFRVRLVAWFMMLIMMPGQLAAVAEDRFLCELFCGSGLFEEEGVCPECLLPMRSEGFFEGKFRLGKTAAILLFPGVQVIDFSGPFEVLGAAGVRVHTVAKRPGVLRTDEGLALVPDFTLDECPDVDLLVLPGGKIYGDPETASWIRDRSDNTEVLLTVCNGLAWLDEAGLIGEREVTTTATSLARSVGSDTKIRFDLDRRVVDSGSIVTTGGYTAGIDGALQVVARWKGEGAARLLAAKLEYDWSPNQGAYKKYRSFFLHLRKLVRDMERASPEIRAARMIDAAVQSDRAHAVWRCDGVDAEEEIQALRGAALVIAGELAVVSEDGRPILIEWGQSAPDGSEWRARIEIDARVDPGTSVRLSVLEVP